MSIELHPRLGLDFDNGWCPVFESIGLYKHFSIDQFRVVHIRPQAHNDPARGREEKE